MKKLTARQALIDCIKSDIEYTWSYCQSMININAMEKVLELQEDLAALRHELAELEGGA